MPLKKGKKKGFLRRRQNFFFFHYSPSWAKALALRASRRRTHSFMLSLFCQQTDWGGNDKPCALGYWKHVSVTPLPSVYFNLVCSQAANSRQKRKEINKKTQSWIHLKETCYLFLVQFIDLEVSVFCKIDELCVLCGTS